MFCPRCASNQSDEVKFCKVCGANLFAVRQVVDTKETEKKFDWSDTWVAEMFMSAEQAERRKAQMELQRGLTPEIKRYNEIKAGIITTSVGIAVSTFLFFFMPGIVLGAHIPPDVAEILLRVWLAGVLPTFIGLAIIFNGVFLSKKIVDVSRRAAWPQPNSLDDTPPPQFRAADTSEFGPAFSVTEQTTKHLRAPDQK